MGEGRLYVTTNLSGEEMVERYSSRVCSRLKELCNPLHLTGGDKRKWANEKLKSSEVEKLKSSKPFNSSTLQPFNRKGGAA